MLDNDPEEPRETIELKASQEPRQPPTAGETLQDRLQAAIGAASLQTPQQGGTQVPVGDDAEAAAGASAAAGVLTAVDEDEDGEDAPVPEDFEYETDGTGEE